MLMSCTEPARYPAMLGGTSEQVKVEAQPITISNIILFSYADWLPRAGLGR